jgi:hypothetical protein
MTLEFDKLNSSNLVIKKVAKDLTLITAKKQDHSSEQVITFVEYPNGNKYISIAPRQIKGSFKYNHVSFLFLIQDLEKKTPYIDKSKVKLITYNPKEKKFVWNAGYNNKAKIEEVILKHLTKRKEALKRFRTIKRV